jgi:integrase/recombinase XerD
MTDLLIPAEVALLLKSLINLKYRAAPIVADAAGLRLSEVLNLQLSDIDSNRNLTRVRQGKGHKDRYVMLSPKLLTVLRHY